MQNLKTIEKKDLKIKDLKDLPSFDEFYHMFSTNIPPQFDFKFKGMKNYHNDVFLKMEFENGFKGIEDINTSLFQLKVPKDILNKNKYKTLHAIVRSMPDTYSKEIYSDDVEYSRTKNGTIDSDIYLEKGEIVTVVSCIKISLNDDCNKESDNVYDIDVLNTMLLVRTSNGYLYDCLYNELEFIDLSNKSKIILR